MVCLVAYNTCGSDTFCESINVLTSIIDIFNADFDVFIFPNPAEDLVIFTFYIPDIQNISLELYDIKGKILYQELIRINNRGWYKRELNLLGYPEGIYLARIVATGNVINRKLIIQRAQ